MEMMTMVMMIVLTTNDDEAQQDDDFDQGLHNDVNNNEMMKFCCVR